MVLNAFTWSKAKDNGAGSLENNGNFAGPQDFRNMDADFATSGYDQPLNNTTSFVCELPFGQGRKWVSDANAVVDAFIGGWTFSGINTMTSGAPVTFTYTPAAAVRGVGHQPGLPRVEQLPAERHRRPVRRQELDHRATSTRRTWSFRPIRARSFGNAERNSVRGPWFWQLDFVASKNFRLPIGSQTNLQIRVEAFNLLNRTNFPRRTATAARRPSARSRRPTTRGRSSWA